MAFRLWRCGGPQPLAGERVPTFWFMIFCVFFGMVRRWRYPKIRIRSSPPYHFSGGVSSASGGPQPLAGEKVLTFWYMIFLCLLWDGEAVATS
jgi:hypothetical protein